MVTKYPINNYLANEIVPLLILNDNVLEDLQSQA